MHSEECLLSFPLSVPLLCLLVTSFCSLNFCFGVFVFLAFIGSKQMWYFRNNEAILNVTAWTPLVSVLVREAFVPLPAPNEGVKGENGLLFCLSCCRNAALSRFFVMWEATEDFEFEFAVHLD